MIWILKISAGEVKARQRNLVPDLAKLEKDLVFIGEEDLKYRRIGEELAEACSAAVERCKVSSSGKTRNRLSKFSIAIKLHFSLIGKHMKT